MPALSDRAHAMPASPIRKLAPYANAAKARGTRVYHLNIGQPDIDSPTEFFDAIRSAPLTRLEYCPSDGLPEVRAKLAQKYTEKGIAVSPDEVLVSTAGSEALLFAMLACLGPGDEVIVPEPMYANYLGFAVTAGVKVVPIPTRLDENFALPGPEAFADRIGPRTKAILICNPNNPTGTVYSDAQLDGLAAIARQHDLYLLADEVYREFNYTGRPIRSVLQLPGLEEHAVMVDSASKRYSLCGARVGFLVSRNRALMASALKFAQARLSPPTLEQIGLLAAFDVADSYLEGVRAEYLARRDLLVRRCRAIPGVRVPQIDGAFYATVALPVANAEHFAQWLLEEFSHEGATVMVAPAAGFYATPGLGQDEVRIAYVLACPELDAAMDCLAAGLAAYPGATR